MAKPGITFKHHQELGREIKDMLKKLNELTVKLGYAYPYGGKKGRAYNSLKKTIKHLNNTRCWLEENYALDCPDNWETETYYGE